MTSHSDQVILIIGGGLGGLALAHLLRQNSPSVQIQIFERDEHAYARDQGYCIGIDSMGFEVLTKIHALNELLAENSDGYCQLNYFQIVNRYLQKLFHFNAREVRLIYREDLRRALLQNLDIHWNKRFLSYELVDDRVKAYFADGTVAEGTVLIGCDGAKSLVREQLIPGFQRKDLNIINIGGTVEDNGQFNDIAQLTTNNLVRVIGQQGHSLLVLPFRQSWMWALSWPEERPSIEYSSINLIDKARRYFQHQEIISLMELASWTSNRVLYRIHSALPLKRNPFPNNPRVTLLGDAAHPMTTHAGKGANTAFADAFDLSQVLLNPTRDALATYEKQMFKRGFAAVQQSLSSTMMIHATGWRAIVRDNLFLIIHYIFRAINFVSLPFLWFRKKRD